MQNRNRTIYLEPRQLSVDGANTPDFPICDAYFTEVEHMDSGYSYDFPSDKLEQFASKMQNLALAEVPDELTGDEEPSLELVGAAMVYFAAFEYKDEVRVGAGDGLTRVTLPDFAMVQAGASKAVNWMANPSFCPSR